MKNTKYIGNEKGLVETIANGTPLEEEHEKIKSEIELMDFDFGDYYDNTDTIIEMVSKVIDNHIEKIKGEIQGLIDFEESCCGNTTLGYECLGVVNKSIEAYYHTLKQAEEEELELDQRE